MVRTKGISTWILRSHDGVDMADDKRLVKNNNNEESEWGVKNAEQDQDQDQLIQLR